MGQERPVRRARKGTGAVTLHEVARLADVAPITVSRAINTPARVSRQVLERVQEAIAQTGYVPNRLAGGLASARSRLVAAVVPTISGPIFQNTIQALHETLVQHGCQLMLGQSGYADSREDELIDAIVGRRPDGIVLTGVLHSTEGRKRLLASGIPVVETWDLSPTPIDMLVGFPTPRSASRSPGISTARDVGTWPPWSAMTSAACVAWRRIARPPVNTGWPRCGPSPCRHRPPCATAAARCAN